MGEPVTLLPLPWSEALAAMKEGRADVLDTVFLTEARARDWDFTAPYAPIDTAVFHKNGLAGIRSPADLRGYVVGVKAGDASADALRTAGVGSFREYPSYEALVDAAVRGEVFVFCMDVPPALHLLYSKGVAADFRQAFVLGEDAFRRAVAKGHSDLLDRVNRGFGLLTPGDRAAIEHRWQGSALPDAVGLQTFLLAASVGLGVILLLIVLVVFLRRDAVRRARLLAGAEAKLRHSEDWAQAVIEALPDLLLVVDSRGTILESHAPPGPEVFPGASEFPGKSYADVLPRDVAAEVQAGVRSLGEDHRVLVLERSLDLGGRVVTYEARVVRMEDGRYLAVIRDISANRRAWENDLHRNKLESLGVLAGGLAHDFNNSLAIIQGFLSLARVQMATPEKALASLDKAVQASRRAAGLTAQLRVLAQGSEVRRTVVSVRHLAEEAAAFALVGSSSVLSIDADQGPWLVEGDPDQLSQVFHNLALNAVQAMPHGGTVTLAFRRITDEKAGARVSVSVLDHGVGIPTEHLGRIFDPYYSTRPKGSGLGLSVVHAVVQRHGGTIEVQSRPGHGASFTVVFPATNRSPEGLEGTDRTRPSEFRGQRALVMEDENDLRELVCLVARGLGFEVQPSRNGREGLAAFAQAEAEGRPFSLVISDLLVPGEMGGREMISELRTTGKPFRALAITGFSVDRSSEDFHNQGFDVIIGKPFTVDELKDRIVELMQSPWKTEPKP
jgi:signal transduction histidine kinase/CheY-like chemotaxis protein